MKPAVFFDRDGVLIKSDIINGKPYAIRDIVKLEIIDANYELIQFFRKQGYYIFAVTNQPDVGNGYVSKHFVENINNTILNKLGIDEILTCYHSQNYGCNCRKPRPGMLLSLASKFDIDLSNSIMIGDRYSDIQAGNAAGCFTFFIDYKYNETTDAMRRQADCIVNSLDDIYSIYNTSETNSERN